MTYATYEDYHEDQEEYEETHSDHKKFVEWCRKQTKAPTSRWLQKKLQEEQKPRPYDGPIDIGKDIGSFIDEMARRPRRKENDEKEFTDEDRRKFMEETDRMLEESWSHKTKEDFIAESVEAYSEIPMFDFGLGEKSNHQAIMDFYGHELYRQIDKEIIDSYDGPSDGRECGQITEKLWQQLRDIRSGRIPNPKYKKVSHQPRLEKSEAPKKPPAPKPAKQKVHKPVAVQQRERRPGDDYRLYTERGIIRNESYRELFKGPGMVYEVIWSNLVRKGWRDTEEYPIRKIYHDERKLLAYCTSWRHLANLCGMSHHTVRRIVRQFEEAGIVKIESFCPKGKSQEQIVIILGYWTGSGKNYNEHYYRDEVFLSPKVGKN